MEAAVGDGGLDSPEGALERLARTLPYTLLASTARDFTRGAHRMHRSVAIANATEICPHPDGYRVALLFDVDTSDAALVWLVQELPTPNIVVRNPANGHAHYLYLLRTWVRENNPAQYAFYEAVADAMARRLGADGHYVGKFVHSPFSKAYETTVCEDRPYDLRELAEQIGLKRERVFSKLPSTHDDRSRNCALFREATRWARRQQLDDATLFNSWHDDVYRFVESHNRFAIALPASEVRSISRSVARYWWERRGKEIPAEELARRSERQRVNDRERKRRKRGSGSRAEYRSAAAARRARALELRQQNVPVREIAAALACSVREVYRVLEAPARERVVIGELLDVVHGCPATQDLYPAREASGESPQTAETSAAPVCVAKRPESHPVVFLSAIPRAEGSVGPQTDASAAPRGRAANDEISSDRGGGGPGEGSWLEYVRERCRENARSGESTPKRTRRIGSNASASSSLRRVVEPASRSNALANRHVRDFGEILDVGPAESLAENARSIGSEGGAGWVRIRALMAATRGGAAVRVDGGHRDYEDGRTTPPASSP